jgi:hypothetical protein
MCGDCITFAELAEPLKDSLGIQGRYIASLTDAWELANIVVDERVVRNEGEKWFDLKQELWKGGDVIRGERMVQGENGFPENYWEVYEKVNVKGLNIYKLSDAVPGLDRGYGMP